MLRAPLLAALLVAVPLAGCLGGGGDTNEPVLKNRAIVSESAGGVHGVVTDAAVQPVEGVTVTVRETGASGRTASDGSYALSNVLAGTYTLAFEADGFVGTEEQVVVRTGQVTTLDVILAHVPSILPFSQAREFTGFVECSVRAGLGFAACGAVNLVAGGNATNDRFLFTWDVEPDPWQLVAEIAWDANQPLGSELSFAVEPNGIPNEGQTAYANGVGASPIVLAVDRTRFEEVDANMTAICNGEKEPDGALAPTNPDAYCRPPLVEEGGTLQARIFVAAAVEARLPDASPVFPGANFGPGLAFQQEYHVIVTEFYHAPACEDYSVFLSNPCEQMTAPPEGVGNATT